MLSKSLQRLTEVLIDPLALIFVCIILGLVWSFYRVNRSRRLAILLVSLTTIGLTLFCSAPAIVNPLVAQLEDRYPTTDTCLSGDLPLVVAAGGLDSRAISASAFQFLSNATKVRTIEAWKLVQSQSDADYPVILTGGGRTGVTEAATMFELMDSLGIDSDRVLLEERSWSTATSAQYTAQLFKEKEMAQNIRLLTSSMHMPRAVASFKKAGFSICAIGVDTQAIRGIPWYSLLPQTSALNKFDLLLHEVVGLIHYKLSGSS